MFDPSKPVQTRDGRKARIICTDLKHPEFPVIAVITDRYGNEFAVAYTKDGRWRNDTQDDSDLLNIPEKRVGWVNAYLAGSCHRDTLYATRAGADNAAMSDRIACVQIEYDVPGAAT
jgi:hypothetical protein